MAELDLEQQQLAVITIDEGEDAAAVRSFVTGNSMQGYLNLIGNENTFRAYHVQAHPYTVLIDRDGRIAKTVVGYAGAPTLAMELQAILVEPGAGN